jgi:circadian clock protein KaiB
LFLLSVPHVTNEACRIPRCRGATLRSAASRDGLSQGDASVAELVLRLYIAGNSASSRRAEQNLHALRASLAQNAWEVEIIDVLSKPELAEQAGVIATPTLSYEHSGRSRRIIGDLSDKKRILEFLGIEAEGESP